MIATYDKCFDELMKTEGGYSDYPNDPGGATKYGISLKFYRRCIDAKATKQTIKNLTETDVYMIYYTYFWKANKCERMPAWAGYLIFDMAVNMGRLNGNKIMQRALQTNPDGVIGPVTLSAMTNCYKDAVITNYTKAREAYYGRLIARQPSLNMFRKGWFNRVRDTANFARTL